MRGLSLLTGCLLGCAARDISNTTAVPVSAGEPCAPPVDCVVRSIRFDGNSSAFQGTGDYNVRAAMKQKDNPSFTFVAPQRRRVYLDTEVLRLDGWRIESWYAHRGFFDARFMGWDINVVRPAKFDRKGNIKRPPAVRITGRIVEGEESVLGAPVAGEDAIIWEGWESLGKGARPILSQLESGSELEAGARFSLSAVQATEGRAVTRMQELSYARASVDSAINVYPEEHIAQVRFTGELGPSCTFGPIEISGDFGIPLELVLAEITLKEGEAFRSSKLAETRARLFALGVFSVVNVTPVLDAEGYPSDVIPIRIDLSERKYRQLKLGGGVLLESGQQDIHTSAEVSHANLLNRLLRVTWYNRIGYTVIGNFELDEIADGDDTVAEEVYVVTSKGLTGESTINLMIPRFPAERFRADLDLGFERGVEQAYQFNRPSLSPSITWDPRGPWSIKLGYELEFLRYFNETADLTDLLGIDFVTNPYLLSSLEETIIYDSRDDPVNVRSGTYSILEFEEAGGPLGGQFSFFRVTADYRRYASLLDVAGLKIGGKSLRRRWGWRPMGAVAGRMAGGIILPYGADTAVPYGERLYLGGGTDVRGWATNYLGPYIRDNCESIDFDPREGRLQFEDIDPCNSENGAVALDSDTIIPIGGQISAQLGMEYRRYFRDTYGLVVFVDSGMVWNDQDSLKDSWLALTEDWSGWSSRTPMLAPTIGLGGRYKSPVGPARLDLALRLDDDERFVHQPRFRIHFALSEAF